MVTMITVKNTSFPDQHYSGTSFYVNDQIKNKTNFENIKFKDPISSDVIL